MTRHPLFRYDSFAIDKSPSRITARFKFSIPPDISFTPEVHFESVPEGWHSGPDEFLYNVVFNLGLIESFSYWKATASPVIEVHAGTLNDDQVHWWHDLLINGMGEFFYRNNIDFTPKDFVKIVAMAGTNGSKPHAAPLPTRSLLTIGGGRDSALTGALLRDSALPFTCMM